MDYISGDFVLCFNDKVAHLTQYPSQDVLATAIVADMVTEA